MSRKRIPLLVFVVLVLSAVTAIASYAWTPTPVKDDPLVRMPGTQPGQVSLESPNRCLNCHAGYNSEVEPGFNWQGSMMAQAARDFLFWSAMTVAGQDAVWAVGTPNATDICLRCHFPKGWLEGRSDPTNASLMTGADYDGVQCDFCHTMWDPFFEETHAGTREGDDWLNYWDETNASASPSQPAADQTYSEDMAQSLDILKFDGSPFFVDNLPFSTNYIESTSGQYFVSSNSDKRASFSDASARHQMLYSRFHKSKYMCAACHDVSNPVLANLGSSGLHDSGDGLITEQYSAANYFHVERTFSEFMLSAYGQEGGAPGIGPFAPDGYETSYGNNNIAKCQDCHMRDVTGVAANKNGAVNRPNESIEHPNSGQPLHDLTGGNVWVSTVLASAIPGSPNYDATNDQLLNQGPAALTLDLNQGQGIDAEAMLAGADRARQQLLLAASINNLSYNPVTGDLSFQVQNQTGHKLISGFPEGRRMFVNIKAYDDLGNLVYEVNPYDYTLGTLKGLSNSPI
ncbi:MAG: multiheme c-type cytochrome, partial [Candidatus Promineifilaceae bacterium]